MQQGQRQGFSTSAQSLGAQTRGQARAMLCPPCHPHQTRKGICVEESVESRQGPSRLVVPEPLLSPRVLFLFPHMSLSKLPWLPWAGPRSQCRLIHHTLASGQGQRGPRGLRSHRGAQTQDGRVRFLISRIQAPFESSTLTRGCFSGSS